MVFYLRDDKNRTVAFVKCFVNKKNNCKYIEYESKVLLVPFAHMVCNLEGKPKHEFIQLMELIQELHDWLDSKYPQNYGDPLEDLEDMIEFIRKILQNVSRRTNLYLIED